MSESIEDKIAKLLRFAADKRGNEAEAANALALAQKLADANNLELMSVNTAEGGKTGPRDDKKLNKGLYQYQRTLYRALAELNHCMIWIEQGTAKGSRYEIRLLGSRLNVTLVRNMADYIEDAANRLVRENMAHVHYFSKAAHLYREGVIDRVVERVKTQRREEEAERERQKREEEARQSHPAAAGNGTAIVLISDVAAEEEKWNYIHLHGEEAWERREAEERAWKLRVENARIAREAAAQELARWEAENPEEAASKAAAKQAEQDRWNAEWQKKREQRERREQRFYEKNGYWPGERQARRKTKYDSTDYYRGRSHGDGVSLNKQINKEDRGALK